MEIPDMLSSSNFPLNEGGLMLLLMCGAFLFAFMFVTVTVVLAAMYCAKGNKK